MTHWGATGRGSIFLPSSSSARFLCLTSFSVCSAGKWRLFSPAPAPLVCACACARVRFAFFFSCAPPLSAVRTPPLLAFRVLGIGYRRFGWWMVFGSLARLSCSFSLLVAGLVLAVDCGCGCGSGCGCERSPAVSAVFSICDCRPPQSWDLFGRGGVTSPAPPSR